MDLLAHDKKVFLKMPKKNPRALRKALCLVFFLPFSDLSCDLYSGVGGLSLAGRHVQQCLLCRKLRSDL